VVGGSESYHVSAHAAEEVDYCFFAGVGERREFCCDLGGDRFRGYAEPGVVCEADVVVVVVEDGVALVPVSGKLLVGIFLEECLEGLLKDRYDGSLLEIPGELIHVFVVVAFVGEGEGGYFLETHDESLTVRLSVRKEWRPFLRGLLRE
jgi:hypothetical protein